MTTLQDAFSLIKQATSLYEKGEQQIISQYILENVLNCSMHKILTGDKDTILSMDQEIHLFQIINNLKEGLPLQYILGFAYFYKYRLEVGKGALIPRPETEELCLLILNYIKTTDHPLRILDIGTGSGCIAYTLAMNLKQESEVVAIDISKEALSIAKKNFEKLTTCCAKVTPIQLDVFDYDTCLLNLGTFDIIVSNPPYISQSESVDMSNHVLNYEPHLALFAPNNDTVAFYRVIGNMINDGLLKEGGMVFVEANPLYIIESAQVIHKDQENINIIRDLSGKNRFIIYHHI